jgi:DNA-binding response OmpR family regulator
MTQTVIRLLHIEDDRLQHAIVARQLANMPEFRFEISIAVSEEDAILSFADGSFDLVILDYHLSAGDGVGCLRRIRHIDPIVPVIAVSGKATDEIAAELIAAGADDYLSKPNLSARLLSQSVRNAITRAKAFRTRFSALAKTKSVLLATR